MGGAIIKTGIIILCRYDSKRLPGKILMSIKGNEVAKYIYDRLETTNIDNSNIIFATSTETSDDKIEDFCERNSYQCFRGDKNDVAGRILDCAKHFNFDKFIRICGDNIFTDKEIINSMHKISQNGNYDLVSNTLKRTFPFGASVEILNTSFYNKIYEEIKNPYDKEHVTSYIYKNMYRYNVYIYLSNRKEYHGVHLALDTKHDLDIITKIINSFEKDHTEYDLQSIVKIYYSITENS